jgi:hypothetical protein
VAEVLPLLRQTSLTANSIASPAMAKGAGAIPP